MTRVKPNLRPRKEPRQQRSRRMRDDILDAGVRVLQREGALRFTTPRVADAAGVSVGSIYQYFPNKQALIFAIHSRAVARAWVEVQGILGNPEWSARGKLQRIARFFFSAESADVAQMGVALQEAEMYFDDQPEHQAFETQVVERFATLVRGALPKASRSHVEFAAHLIVTALESVGKSVARRKLGQQEINRWADECAAMLADHVGLP